jgi:hypothetical protein
VAQMRNTLSHTERWRAPEWARRKIFFPSRARVRAVMHAKEDIEDAPSRTRMRHRRALNERRALSRTIEEGAVAHDRGGRRHALNEALSRTE